MSPTREHLAKVRRRLRRAVQGRRHRRAALATSTPPATDPVYPAVVEERTNVGPMMDALVTRMKQNQAPLGVDPDYDLLRENFDHHNFLLQNQILQERPQIDPIRLFLRAGPAATNSPNYNFSMQSYLERHPERADGPEHPYLEWIRHGRAAGEIADPGLGIEKMSEVLDLEPSRIVDELVETRTDMMDRLRTGTLGEMFAKAAEIEPLIGAAWGETTRTRLVPLGAKFVAGQVAAIHDCHEEAGFRRARVLLVTGGAGQGSDGRTESQLAHALAGAVPPQDIVVIYTDEAGRAPEGRLPAGVREVDFATATDGLPGEHRRQALVSLLRSFRAEAILNLDSEAMYGAMLPYGKALAVSERIFLCFSGNQQRPQGNWDGWSLRWFYTGFDLAEGLLVESAELREELIERHQLSKSDAERVRVLPTAADPVGTAELAAWLLPSGDRARKESR